MQDSSHTAIEPAILYAGTPVVVISTLNEDGSVNLAPISSAWWLGWSCMLGLDATSKTVENLKRTRECVLNLASVDNVAMVNRLAKLTGSRLLPLHKKALGYRSENDKVGASGFTTLPADLVGPPRVAECLIQLEGRVASIRTLAARDERMAIPSRCIEVTIQRVNAAPSLTIDGHPNRIDPDKWRPLIMSFRELYGLGTKLCPSKLATGPEEQYATWKLSGAKAVLVKSLLKFANRAHAKGEHDDASAEHEEP